MSRWPKNLILAGLAACTLLAALAGPVSAPSAHAQARPTTRNLGAAPADAAKEEPRAAAKTSGEGETTAPAPGVAGSVNRGNPAPIKGPAPRVALVIGNSAYANVTALPNPGNDARAVAQLLNAARFEVIAAIDLNRSEMVQVLQDFAARIVERGPDTVALIYYAGHGLQVAGENYLVPVDAAIATEDDIPGATIRLVDVMATLDSVKSRTRVVILDACRNNPFAALGDAGRGLAIVDAPNGSIVAYSTAPGAEALDGAGDHSPYTNAFLKLARAPNVPIEQFFKRVRLLVNDVTDGRQTPWESSSLTSDFFLFTDSPELAAAEEAKPYEKPKSTYQLADIRKRSVRGAYDIVIEEDSIEYYEEFIEIYPDDPLAARIRALLESRLLMQAWFDAVVLNTPLAYQAFGQKFGASLYAKSAAKLALHPKVLALSKPSQIFSPKRRLPDVKLPVKPANDKPQAFKPKPLDPDNKKVIKLPAKEVKKKIKKPIRKIRRPRRPGPDVDDDFIDEPPPVRIIEPRPIVRPRPIVIPPPIIRPQPTRPILPHPIRPIKPKPPPVTDPGHGGHRGSSSTFDLR